MCDNAKTHKSADSRAAGERHVGYSGPAATMKKDLTIVIKLGMAFAMHGSAQKVLLILRQALRPLSTR